MTNPPTCANCGATLNGPYCSNCGQKASDLHRPFWWILGEFLDSVFGYDSRTFRTLWLLFAQPGEFTRRYNSGRRASLLPPFRLFLIATVVFFLILQATGLAIVAFRTETVSIKSLSPAVVEALKSEPNARLETEGKDEVGVVRLELFVPAAAQERVELSEDQKRRVADIREEVAAQSETVKQSEGDWLRWFQATAIRAMQGFERALADPIKLNAPLNVWLPRLMLVLVPIFSLLLAVMHWSPRVFLIEHLVFSIHIHTVLFVALSFVALGAALLGHSGFLWAIWLILAVYLWMAMYRVYGRSWWLTSLKFVGLLFVYLIILMMGLALTFVVALSEV